MDKSCEKYNPHLIFTKLSYSALLLAYCHDCCNTLYSPAPPLFQSAEVKVNLPCDDPLWTARTAEEWLKVAQASSPYGTGAERISGVSMQLAMSVLGGTHTMIAPLSLNPFAQFLLIHTILRNISQAKRQSIDGHVALTMAASECHNAQNVHPFGSQSALDIWFQVWLRGPESMRLERGPAEPPFVCNSLPFYWQARVLLLEQSTSLDAQAEGNFHLMKEWLDHLRGLIRRGDDIPYHLWADLLTSQTQSPQVDDKVKDESELDIFTILEY